MKYANKESSSEECSITDDPENDHDDVVKSVNFSEMSEPCDEPVPLTDGWNWVQLNLRGKAATWRTGGLLAETRQFPYNLREKKKSTEPKMPAGRVLTIMKDCNLAWDQMRKLRQFMYVSTSVEGTVHLQQKNLLKSYVEGKMVPLQFASTEADAVDGCTTQEIPFVKVGDLCAVILDYLAQLDQTKTLTWHNGVIPKDEIWVKLGAVQGGSPFKMVFQIVNVPKPSCPKNTVVCAFFNADDSYYNLQKTLPMLLDQSVDLAKFKWRGLSFRILIFGDYAFLTKLCGISDMNARHCCIYCRITKDEMQQPLCRRKPAYRRSLTSINDQYRVFVNKGRHPDMADNISYSVANRPLLPVDMDDVIIPAWQISLDVYQALYDLLETECHRLDVEIHKQMTTITSIDHRPVSAMSREAQLQNDKTPQEQNMPGTEPEFGTGPLASRLQDVLNKYNVHRQAKGKSFTYNHVDICCQVHVIDELTSHPQSLIDRLVLGDMRTMAYKDIKRRLVQISETFGEVFLKFAAIHQAISHTCPLEHDDIVLTGLCIKEFLHAYRESFPMSNVSPVMHLLEDHVLEQMKRFHVGLGLLHEEGSELYHPEFNRMRRAGKSDMLPKLMNIMRRHLTSTFPDVHSEIQDFPGMVTN